MCELSQVVNVDVSRGAGEGIACYNYLTKMHHSEAQCFNVHNLSLQSLCIQSKGIVKGKKKVLLYVAALCQAPRLMICPRLALWEMFTPFPNQPSLLITMRI